MDNDHLFGLLPGHRIHRQLLAVFAGLFVDENRTVLHVNVFRVHGHHANRVDPHVRDIPNEVCTSHVLILRALSRPGRLKQTKKSARAVGELHGLSWIFRNPVLVLVYALLSAAPCRRMVWRLFVDFDRNYKNDLERSLVYTSDCCVIKIEDNVNFHLYLHRKKKLYNF